MKYVSILSFKLTIETFYLYSIFFLVRIDVRLVVTFHVYIVHIIVNNITLLTLKERDVSIELKLYG